MEAEVAKTPKTKLETLRNEQAKIEEENIEHKLHDKEKLEKHFSMKQEDKGKFSAIIFFTRSSFSQLTAIFYPMIFYNILTVKVPVSEIDIIDTPQELTTEDVKTLSEAVDKLESIREGIADIKTELAEDIPKEKLKEMLGAVEVEPEVTKTKAEKILAKKVQILSIDSAMVIFTTNQFES